jgi:hypothetical protein
MGTKNPVTRTMTAQSSFCKAAILMAAVASSRCFGAKEFSVERIASADSWINKGSKGYRNVDFGLRRRRVDTINRSSPPIGSRRFQSWRSGPMRSGQPISLPADLRGGLAPIWQ